MAMSPLLMVHVGAGAAAILSGAVTVAARKGALVHRISGTVFVLSMTIMAGVAAYIAALIPARISIVAGTLALYLVATAWMTVRRREGTIGPFEFLALFAGLGVAALGATYGLQATATPNGALDGFPAAIYFMMASVAGLGAVLDLKVVLSRGISSVPRIARHLWRMSTAFFIATGSFFMGQQKIMPDWILQGRPILFALGLAPLVLMAFWLIKVRFTKWYDSAGATAAREGVRSAITAKP